MKQHRREIIVNIVHSMLIVINLNLHHDLFCGILVKICIIVGFYCYHSCYWDWRMLVGLSSKGNSEFFSLTEESELPLIILESVK